MLLCLDVGNTHILGGVYHDDKLLMRFRYATHLMGTSDQLGMFLITILQANHVKPADIKAAAICSVVPSCDYTLKHALTHYFNADIFVLQAGVKTGLNIKYKNPNEVGADRIANAIGAVSALPHQNIIVIDMGTATTVCAITKTKDYLGGTILPGMRLGMESLKNNAAKLMEVDIEIPSHYVGRTTRESIQSGLFFGQLGALKEVITGYKKEVFHDDTVTIVGTGGFSQLFKDYLLFDRIVPDLVLNGLCKAYEFSTKG